MTNALQVFNYQSAQVRTYTDERGEAWFVAKDVCDVLGLANARDAISSLDDDEKNTVAISDGNRGNPNTNVINEPGLYALVFRSNKPEAKAFARWVRHDVLPAIRKTGSYTGEPSSESESVINLRAAELLQRLALQVSSKENRELISREAYKYATGHDLPVKVPEPAKRTPRHWTAEQIGKVLKWPADAVMNRAENLGLTKKSVNGWWDGGTWMFTKVGRQKLLDLVLKKVVKIEDGYEYYESGGRMVHWEFDADAARI